ncbi:hypothetical protein HYH03_002952 [Edaphochlamys debaryana]|uniref:Uncharacterized protein n=1 Tax=Edaphochlamys debaryana TaxID=47281 RepID=A0A836C545_9CHLO|nr:hypothetical protein HYH03_002952 [Edaphochlamys debaryana]|eukprot:KAG2499377.1 hypothetical protein HYH03_002952 [Edaphochlamys debaryana]
MARAASPLAANTRLELELRSTKQVLSCRDEEIDAWRCKVEELRDQLVSRELVLAQAQQSLRASEAEKQLLVAQAGRLEDSAKQAASRHALELQAAEDRRQQELQALGRERDEVVGSLRGRMAELADQLDEARRSVAGLLGERERMAAEVEAAGKRAADAEAAAEAARRAQEAAERLLADTRDERAKAVMLRDERISELQQQVTTLSRAGDARSIEAQAALGSTMGHYNALRSACDRQTAELEAARAAERRTAAALAEAERQLAEARAAAEGAKERANELQAELKRRAALATANEAELRALKRQQQRAAAAAAERVQGAAAAAATVQDAAGSRAEAALRQLEALQATGGLGGFAGMGTGATGLGAASLGAMGLGAMGSAGLGGVNMAWPAVAVTPSPGSMPYTSGYGYAATAPLYPAFMPSGVAAPAGHGGQGPGCSCRYGSCGGPAPMVGRRGGAATATPSKHGGREGLIRRTYQGLF